MPSHRRNTLKEHLQNAPLLAYPCLNNKAGEFKVHTDASAVGVVLEQDDHVMAYASQALTAPERQYSVIQRECLAVIHKSEAVSSLPAGLSLPDPH